MTTPDPDRMKTVTQAVRRLVLAMFAEIGLLAAALAYHPAGVYAAYMTAIFVGMALDLAIVVLAWRLLRQERAKAKNAGLVDGS